MNAFLFLALTFFGFFSAYLYGKGTKRFRLREYVAMFAVPAGILAYLIAVEGFLPLGVYLAGAAGFSALEWLVGFSYHKILGAPLWQYQRYTLPGRYTSYLAMPVWGFGAIFIWLLMR